MPWPEETRRRLRAALPPAPVTMGEVCALDVLVGEAFAAASLAGQHDLAGGGAELVASHGQNVFHWVTDGRARGTLQLGQPAIIAEATGLPVVSDLRARDIAAGGQGAPLASTLDALWLGGAGGPRAALNLGGIANITVVGEAGGPVLAYDTGPASCLLDIAAARLTAGAQHCDLDGRLALSGIVRTDLLGRLLAEPYYAAAPPKSTGRELFDTGYVARCLDGLPDVTGPDLMATLTQLTASTVAAACCHHGVTEVVASGGGVRNPALMAALGRELGAIRLVTSDERGLPSDAKEAYLFALLGFLSWHGLAGTIGGATGARAPRILGRISPGLGPLRLPAPRLAPVRLVVAG
jgi:anhydro-N-acetylmuramic acid kinase